MSTDLDATFSHAIPEAPGRAAEAFSTRGAGGKIFAIAAVSGADEAEISPLPARLFRRFEKLLADAAPGIETFEAAVSALSEDFAPELGAARLDAVVGRIVGAELQLAPAGRAAAFLRRRGKLTAVVEPGTATDGDGLFPVVAAGRVVPGDEFAAIAPAGADFAAEGLEKIMAFSLADRVKILSADGILLGAGEPGALFFELGGVGAPVAAPRAGFFTTVRETVRHRIETIFPAAREKFAGFAAATGDRIRGITGDSDRRTAALALFAMVVILATAVGVLLARNASTASVYEFQRRFAALDEDFARAERILIYDKTEAMKLLKTLDEEAGELLSFGRFSSRVLEKKAQIEEKLFAAQNITVFENPEPAADFAAARAGGTPKGLFFDGETLRAWDDTAVYAAVADLATAEKITGLPTGTKISAAKFFENDDAAVLLTEDGRVFSLRGDVAEEIPTVDGAISHGGSFASYGSNLYFLDPAQNQVWKYVRRTGDLGPAQAYNKSGAVSRGVDLAIDGNIFVLNDDGTVEMLFRGDHRDFTIENLPSPLEEPRAISTTIEGQYLYILDKNSVTAVRKNGEYSARWTFPGRDLRAMAIDETNFRGWVLDAEGQAFEFSL